jgi:probable HAF family extracellular repeat protein
MREKSLERRILLTRSFHLSGRLGAAFARVRCWLATIADRRSASIGTAMWLDTLQARMARELSCGREAGASATWAFCPAAITAARLTSTTRMRLPAHLGARLVSVPSFGPTNGNIRDLGTLPGDTSSEASAIDNNGDVVGYSKGPRGMRAFLWTQASGMQDLGVLPGGNSSRALGINDMGAVVGTSTSSSGDRAFIWTRETGMRDLNSAASMTSGAVFVEAHAINNAGQILVTGTPMHESHLSNEAASQRAPAPPSSFLLTPTSM